MTAPLPEINLATESIILVVAWREGRTLVAGDIGLERSVATHMREVCAATLTDLKGRRWRDADPEASLMDDEVIRVLRDALRPPPPVLGVLDGTTALDQLSVDALPQKSLLFYAVVAGDPPARYVAFLRKVNPYVAYKAGWFATFLGDRLTSVDGAVFRFDDTFDLIVTQDTVFALSTTVYDLFFRDTELLTARIPEYITKIGVSLPLDPGAEADLQTLAMKSSRVRARLRSLADRGYLAGVTVDALAESARRQGIEPNRLIRDGHLILDKDDPHLLLQVLNEDLYTGDLSKIPYAVDRKSARKRKGT